MNFVNNQKQGILREWHENGLLSASGNMVNGNAQGKVDFYDSAGILANTETYSNGARLPSMTDVHTALEYIRNKERYKGHELLSELENKMDIGYDSAAEALRLFTTLDQADYFGYALNLFNWIIVHHPDRIAAEDYIRLSIYERASGKYDYSGVLDSALSKLPHNLQVQFAYAHNRHVEKTEKRDYDNSFEYYESWLEQIRSQSKAPSSGDLSEAKDVILKNDFHVLYATSCKTNESVIAIQKLRKDMESIKKLGLATSDAESELAEYERECNNK